MKFINVDNPKVLAFTRSYQDEHLLVVVNLSKYSQAAEVDIHEFQGAIPVEVFSKNHFPAVKEQPYFFTLGPHSFQWFELRSKNVETINPDTVPEVQIHGIDDLLEGMQKTNFESNILPLYLKRSEWFAKSKRIFTISIRQHEKVDLPTCNAHLLLIEVVYEDGLPEFFHLPLTLVKNSLERKLRESCPQAFIAHVFHPSGESMLCDAFYTPELQRWLFNSLAANSVINLQHSVLHFSSNDALKNHIANKGELISRVHSTDYKNTSITYDNSFFLKMFRKLDVGINPDVELTRYLTEETDYKYIPAFLGSIEWMLEKENLSLGMMQVMVENHGDGKSYMTERVQNYIERILAMGKINSFPLEGSFTNPVPYEKLSGELQVLLGGPASEQAALLGKRIAGLHETLAADKGKPSFETEEFSLHYQRSLFSAMQSLVRECFQTADKNVKDLPVSIQQDIKNWGEKREEILASLKRIYIKKLEALKTRIHGNLHLDQILLTGRDIAIHDFGGDPHRNFSERRLKRSPLRDVASMIRSFYYVVYETILSTSHVPAGEIPGLLSYAPLWAHYMSGFFTHAYFENIQNKELLPSDTEDLDVMLDTYLIEKSLMALHGELSKRPTHIIIPLQLLKVAMHSSMVEEEEV